MANKGILDILGGYDTLVPDDAHAGRSWEVRDAGVQYGAAAKKSKELNVDIPHFKMLAVKTLSERLSLAPEDMLSLINVRGRTAQRRQQEGMLTPDESDRLYRVARVTEHAERVFRSAEKAHMWLKRPNSMFNQASPFSLLGSDVGAEEVSDELNRIEYGDLY